MGILIGMLSLLVWIGTVVCLVIVLIKLFQNEGPIKGILGLICGLYTFIWGWMNADRLNIKTIMLAWTALIIVAILLRGLGAAFSVGY
jgi:hypothetical protein